MPKMDGIETVQKLRAMGYGMPVIALTANAMTGQAEMFQKNGFDGYISKPIDIRQLNASLNRTVRDRHPAGEIRAARRLKDGLEKLYARESATRPMVTDLAENLIRDIKKAAAVMERGVPAPDNGNSVNDDDIRGYIDAAGALNNALAGIGETELAGLASGLEKACLERDFTEITEKTPRFFDGLRALVEKIAPKREENEAEKIDRDFLTGQLRELVTACADKNLKSAKTAVIALNKKSWPRHIKDRINSITEYVMKEDFDAVTAAVKKLENI